VCREVYVKKSGQIEPWAKQQQQQQQQQQNNRANRAGQKTHTDVSSAFSVTVRAIVIFVYFGNVYYVTCTCKQKDLTFLFYKLQLL
jgi:bifunctional DNase/RNase